MSQKLVHQVDADGYFVGPVKAIASPLEPGLWQLPAGTVDVELPAVPDGFRAKLVDGAFVLEAIPVEPDPDPPTLPERRDGIWQQIKAIRQEKSERGGFPVAGKWFHSDVFSRTQQLGLIEAARQFVMAGGQITDPIPGVPPWSTMDNSTLVLTPAVVSQFLVVAAAQDGALFEHAKALRALVDASVDPESVDINAGWPSTYQTKNINTASTAMLEEIQGIGPAIAQAIVDGRPWAAVQDLSSLPSVSESALALWLPQLSV